MRRLLQFGTFLLLITALLTPVVEFFDRWDPPGPSNDTEMAVFALCFALCLVLLVCRLIADRGKLVTLIAVARCERVRRLIEPVGLPARKVPSQGSPPLRI